jgi:hypothetical protein
MHFYFKTSVFSHTSASVYSGDLPVLNMPANSVTGTVMSCNVPDMFFFAYLSDKVSEKAGILW